MKLLLTNKKSYYWSVYKKHWKSISVLILLMLTLPLYVFLTLPPVEIVNEVPQTQVVHVPTNITTTTITTRNVSLNVTQGSSVFLSKQAPPPVIDSDIVVVVDTSGSMAGAKLSTAISAINGLISALNQSSQNQHLNDRIGLVTFGGNTSTSSTHWTDDAMYQTRLGYVNNQTFLNEITSKTNQLTTGITGTSTDIWAGLNFSLQLLVNNPRNGPSLQSVILLTDGVDNMGPFQSQVQAGNYTGFLASASNFSTDLKSAPYSLSPVEVARNKGIKIDTIGISQGSPTYDESFLVNIATNTSYGTFGQFFKGNNQLSISESFLQARDSASGWVQLISSNTTISSSGTNQLYSFNVTQSQRRLKWDVNWVNKSVLLNGTLEDPNGTVISLNKLLPDNFNLISKQSPISLTIDFPDPGIWKFNITWANVSSQERILSRLSSYQPPVYIDSVSQLNTSTINKTTGATSITFDMKVANKNPLFNFTNIKPSLLANFSAFNYTDSWAPASVAEISFNSSTTFTLNITFLQAVQIQGSFLMTVNSSEGYYDAYSQPLSFNSLTTLTNTTTENVVQTQTVVSTALSTSTGYNYDRQVFNQLNWVGFALTFLLLFGITLLYIRSKEANLRKLASQLRPSFLRSKKSIVSGLTTVGVDTSNISIDQLLSEITHLDDLGSAIGSQTGTVLSTEDLIKVASGVATDKIASRLSNKTGTSLNDILDLIASSASIEDISRKLNMSYDDFMFIITPDEQVDAFQSLMKSLVTPLGAPTSSRMFINDNINLNDFRNKIKKTII